MGERRWPALLELGGRQLLTAGNARSDPSGWPSDHHDPLVMPGPYVSFRDGLGPALLVRSRGTEGSPQGHAGRQEPTRRAAARPCRLGTRRMAHQYRQESAGAAHAAAEREASLCDSSGSSEADDFECMPELAQAEITVAGHRIRLIQPKDVDEVIEMYIRQGRMDRDPYWCRLWPSAIALAEEILLHPELVAGRKVCDLGAGLGLAGLAAAIAGASEVVLLDREIVALQCAMLTAHANLPGLSTNLPLLLPLQPSRSWLPAVHPTAMPSHLPASALPLNSMLPISDLQARTDASLPACQSAIEDSDASCTPTAASRCSELASNSSGRPGVLAHCNAGSDGAPDEESWPGSSEGSSCPAYHDTQQRGPLLMRAEVFDWGDKDACMKEFDVVLACDVLYEKPAVDLIADLVPRLLRPCDNPLLLISDPVERNPKNRERFVDLMDAANGPMLLELQSMETRMAVMDNSAHPIELLAFAGRAIEKSKLPMAGAGQIAWTVPVHLCPPCCAAFDSEWSSWLSSESGEIFHLDWLRQEALAEHTVKMGYEL
eukprot:SM000028S10160  [mRNA]  locus=s28:699027:702642:+ [translate_table: standard]